MVTTSHNTARESDECETSREPTTMPPTERASTTAIGQTRRMCCSDAMCVVNDAVCVARISSPEWGLAMARVG
jgi:hypothetical protein